MRTGRSPRATAVLLAALVLLFGAALAGPATAQPAQPTSPTSPTQPSRPAQSAQQALIDTVAPAAAGWLARQLKDGNHMEVVFGGVAYPDAGLTADVVLAFDAADVAQDFAAAATRWLADPDVTTGYVGDGETESYPGALAKLALVAIAQGENPKSFGGEDLVQRLRERQGESGRFSDKSQYGDYTNGITQSLAILALLRAKVKVPGAALDYLTKSQCDDGGFPLRFEEQTCASEVDATAFAIQALHAAGRTGAADDALDYLEKVQAADGGFGGGGPTSAVNANSTGLAAQALRVGGRTDAAEAAVGYLLKLQVGCAAPAEQRGAIAYDGNGFDAGTAIRATAQSLYGLSGTGLHEIDNEGDAGTAPTMACAPPSPTETAAPTTAPGGTAPPPQGGTGPGDLPATGSVPEARAAVLGAVLVLVGAAAVLFSRRSRPSRAGDGP